MHKMRDWLRLAFARSIVCRGLVYSVVVGTVLTAINHGDSLLNGQVGSRHLFKIGLTYVVPYVVSTLSSVAALNSRTE
ncbi:putative transmembrane protein [Rhodopirellula islandica]|uniref:Transmembrane protein n=1 Tax=Rhodopirellula islandica TaxID=595434 RepID=A0A0J1BK48_RHOIS|nr:putative transmembrane protein [Rhodopirellula islandica]